MQACGNSVNMHVDTSSNSLSASYGTVERGTGELYVSIYHEHGWFMSKTEQSRDGLVIHQLGGY